MSCFIFVSYSKGYSLKPDLSVDLLAFPFFSQVRRPPLPPCPPPQIRLCSYSLFIHYLLFLS